ncbi:type II toxin-antitoxin system VapC family toxin [Polyangium sp. 15x6]|uniref:type II toxin-antitoxin system VapC family toxin n=1 Tax=Polyangium sp. 15x6 TaxID=3042687 RepID=UPI00249A0501|nr:type II toxin-antitoxin system VapC family toxin [Polyangium sp. 15x6]MDI3288878.1 type II toxin-antitoxin system VapC family toxin [Polyangium sp. 15x6]
MSAYLLDTNALIYYYCGDSLGRAIEPLLASPSAHFYVTNLAVVEIRSALASMVRREELKMGGYRLVMKRFSYDISSLGRFRVQPIRHSFVDPCIRMIEEYALRQGLALSTLDCLHLLAARDLQQREPDLQLVTADRAFANIADLAGVPPILLEAPEQPQ